jgi:hypothetical protein
MEIPEYLGGLLVFGVCIEVDAQVLTQVVPTADQNQFVTLIIRNFGGSIGTHLRSPNSAHRSSGK